MAGGRRHRREKNGETFLESVKLRLERLELLITDIHWAQVGQWQMLQTSAPLATNSKCGFNDVWSEQLVPQNFEECKSQENEDVCGLEALCAPLSRSLAAAESRAAAAYNVCLKSSQARTIDVV